MICRSWTIAVVNDSRLVSEDTVSLRQKLLIILAEPGRSSYLTATVSWQEHLLQIASDWQCWNMRRRTWHLSWVQEWLGIKYRKKDMLVIMVLWKQVFYLILDKSIFSIFFTLWACLFQKLFAWLVLYSSLSSLPFVWFTIEMIIVLVSDICLNARNSR